MSSKEELQREFQLISNELQRFDEYGKQIQGQIEAVQNFLIDLSRSKTTLAGLKEEKDADETLIQMGAGIMIRAKPIEPDKVFYNVGAGVVVEKSLDEALKEIDNRIEEVEKERTSLADQLNQVINQINILERRAQSIYQEMQGPAQASYDPSLVS